MARQATGTTQQTDGDSAKQRALRHLVDANHPAIQWSPFADGTVRAGATDFDHINGVFHAVGFGHDPADAYRAMHEKVVLYDAAIERQLEFRGPDAPRLANRLVTRDLRPLEVNQACYGYICWPDGAIITDAVVISLGLDRLWVSPTNAEALLWAQGVAHAGEFEVEVDVAPWASAHLHGPRAVDVLRDLVGELIDDIPPYRCTWAHIEDTETLVSRTVASPSGGFEVFVPEQRAMPVWEALVAAGKPHGLMVTGFDRPAEALEAGMVMIAYSTNAIDRLNPLEMWRTFLDFTGEDFIGKEALERIVASGGPTRRLVGMVGGAGDLPPLYDRWSVESEDGEELGFTRWVVRSPALDRNIAYAVLPAEYAKQVGSELTVVHSAGSERMTIAELPFIEPRK